MAGEETTTFQDHLFDSTIAFDESPDALAAYIEAGGELDQGMRVHQEIILCRIFRLEG